MSINQMFEALAANSSRNFKIDFLKRHSDDVVFKKAIKLALDPTINFHIKKIPAYFPQTDSTKYVAGLDHSLIQLEQKLASREVTGNAAIEFLIKILSNSSPEDARVIEKVIQRDLRCGVSESSVNSAWPGTIPEFPYQSCISLKAAKLEKFNWKKGVLAQEKCDGTFTNINHFEDGGVELRSRSGTVWPADQFMSLNDSISRNFKKNTQTHGEMLVARHGEILPRELGNGILNSVAKGGSFDDGDYPVLVVWDQIPLSESTPGNKYKIPYGDRFNELIKQVKDYNFVSIVPTRIVHTINDAKEYYEEMLALGKEGIILKDAAAIWEDTTSKWQVKFKQIVDVDLKIVGFTEGKGKNSNTFGAIVCESSDGKLAVNVSGFKDKKQKGVMTRQEIFDIKEDLISTIIVVTSNAIMKPTKSNPKYSLFLPRFSQLRDDKSKADSLQQIQDQFESSTRGNK